MVKSITIKAAYVPELIEVFGESYQAEIWDGEPQVLIPNPQTKAQYASGRFDEEWRNYVTSKVQSYRIKMADIGINKESILEQ